MMEVQQQQQQQRQCVFGAVWDDAGTRLAASDAHGRICVWDDPFAAAAEAKKKARVWKQRRMRGVLRSDEESSPVYALAALPAAETCGGDGCSQRLLSGGVGGVALWKWRFPSSSSDDDDDDDSAKEEPIATIESDCGETNGIAVAAAAGRFVRAVGTFGVRSRDGCVAVHSAATLQQTSAAMGSAGCGAFLCVASLSSSSDFGGGGSGGGVRFAAGSEDGCVRIFDDRCSSAATLCCCLQRCECGGSGSGSGSGGGSAAKAAVLSVAADGPWIASGDAAGCVALWHIAAPARPLAVAAAGSAVTALCFVGDSSSSSSSSATKTRHLLCGTGAGRVVRMSVSGRVESERSAPCGAVFAIAERPTAASAGNVPPPPPQQQQQPSERLAMSASVLHSEPTVAVAGLSETVCVLRGSVCAAELAFPSPA